MDIETFIRQIPKAELHVHYDGTLEPELMFKIAERNKITIRYKTLDEVRKAYNFSDLQSFLDVYYEGARVLKEEQDFYEVAMAYFTRVSQDNARHVELFYNPQTHTDRGIPFETVLNGIQRAMTDAKSKFNITSHLIFGILRHLSEEEAFKSFEQVLKYKHLIKGIGLDSSEVGHPPSKFKNIYEIAQKEGFECVAHAGEEGPSSYIWEAINLLKVKRIDHGIHSLDDPKLIKYLNENQIPLTVCPLSNIKLCAFPTMKEHCILKLLNEGLKVTINSDDPAYFDGYLVDNFLAIERQFGFSKKVIYELCRNSFDASFLTQERRKQLLDELNLFYEKNK